MRRRAVYIVVGAILLSISACADATAPRSRVVLAPSTLRKTVGPPDVSGSVGAIYNNSTTLYNFPYETWVTLEVTGTVAFTSSPPAQGASPFYQYPGRSDVTATGLYDGRQDTGCAMNLSVVGALFNGGNFGTCGSAQQINISKIVGGSVTVRRGPPPKENSYDCDPWGQATCHSVSGSQSVRLRPVPVALKAKASPKVVNFAAGTTPVTFTGFLNPDSLTVQGGRQPFTFALTSWQWITADSNRVVTLTSVPSCVFPSGVAATRNCIFTPQGSGRMVLSGFAGGYQQTGSTSVQCFTSPADFIANDTANDFSAREELLEALSLSHSDSSPTAGWNASNPKGWKNETPGVLWKFPNGGGYQFVPYNDPSSTACRASLPPSTYAPSAAPVPGAEPVAGVHVHPNKWFEPIYGCDSVDVKGVKVRGAQSPGDVDENGQLRPVGTQLPEDEIRAGSDPDWRWVQDSNGLPMFIMTAVGYALRLDDPMTGNLRGPHKSWPITKFALDFGGEAARKCAWPKKYEG